MEKSGEKGSLVGRSLDRFYNSSFGKKLIMGVYDFLIRNFPDYFKERMRNTVEYDSLVSCYSELREGFENTRMSLEKEQKAREKAGQRIHSIEQELGYAYKEQRVLRNNLQLAYEENAELQEKVKRCSPERIDDLEVMLQKKDDTLGNRNKLIQLQRHTISRERRAYKFLKAQERRNMLYSCIKDNVKRKEDIFILNHTGRIVAQSESAEKAYGNLKGKHYFDLVSGSLSEKEKVEQEFNKEIEGWIELNQIEYGKKDNHSETRQIAAYVSVCPKYFLERVERQRGQELEDVEVRYGTVIEVSRYPFKETIKRIISGEKVFQEKLRDRMQKVQEALETSKRFEERENKGLEGLSPA
jgi:hypothetical protein